MFAGGGAVEVEGGEGGENAPVPRVRARGRAAARTSAAATKI